MRTPALSGSRPGRSGRYFDATAHAEFLYERVAETVERDLPREVAYLEGFDRFAEGVQRLLGDMPHSTVDLLHRFVTRALLAGAATFVGMMQVPWAGRDDRIGA